jgi:molybdate transport system substrate-binding protein
MNKKSGITCLMLICSIVFGVTFFSGAYAAEEELKVTVFAAASATNAINEVGQIFENKEKVKFITSFAAASTLAKQIEQGAPADIFISANTDWMDYLDAKKLLEPGSRFDLLSNSIVLIAPINSPVGQVDLKSGTDLVKYLGDGLLSMGDPDHVPAGTYGMQALKSLGMWQGVENRIARANDVRAALALVERGETSLGIVYATDAKISDKVKVVGVFPRESHPPVVYPVALVAGRKSGASMKFIEILKSPEAKNIFTKYGFVANFK